jgi:D-xylose transport system substrate-binding protein
MKRGFTRLAAVGAAAVVAAGLAACGGDDNGGGGGGGGGEAKQIALLLPETKTARYEAHDRPGFTNKVKELCPKCEVIYANAAQDPNKQQTQAEAAITRGADVLVLDAVDAKAATGMVQRAKQAKIPVLAYDRLISNADIDYYVSFDNVRQGRIQAQSLLDGLGSAAKGKSIVMVNGAPTDPSAGDYKKGAHQVLDKSGVKIAKEYSTRRSSSTPRSRRSSPWPRPRGRKRPPACSTPRSTTGRRRCPRCCSRPLR